MSEETTTGQAPGQQMTFADCYGLGGSGMLGAVQAGFKLVRKYEGAGQFGVALMNHNRHLLGDDWDVSMEPLPVDAVFGLPPCSGWSTYTSAIKRDGKPFRGEGSPVEHCMHDLVKWAGQCDPDVVVFESVQQLYTQGRRLCLALRDELEDSAEKQFDLTHVRMSLGALGGAQHRRRYFWVATRRGLRYTVPDAPARGSKGLTYGETIQDLTGLDNTWDAQWRGTLVPSSDYTRSLRNGGVVYDHVWPVNPMLRRCEDLRDYWAPGMNIRQAAQALLDRGGKPPGWWRDGKEYDAADGRALFGTIPVPFRPPWESYGRVVTGGGGQMFLHPSEFRYLSVRECARLMGLPDAWRLDVMRSASAAFTVLGKAVSPLSYRHIATGVRETLLGNECEVSGRLIGDREYFIDLEKEEWKS